MDLQAAKKLFAHATRQRDRWPAALDPEFAKADDRSLPELIDFACRFSSLINYYALDNRVDGDWVEFYTRDPLMTMASIVGTDINSAERRLVRLERRAREASTAAKSKRFKALLKAALELPRQTNRWLVGLTSPFAQDVNFPLRRALESSVRDTLRRPLRQLLDGNPCGLEYQEFAGPWQLEADDPPTSIYMGRSEAEQVDAALPWIMSLWHPFAEATAEWAARSRPQLASALEGNAPHQPHVAMFIAFARLFSEAQASINAVAARRTAFYFRRVLRDPPRPAVPDRAYVAFTGASEQDATGVVVPSGTLLSGGKDAEGREIVFASQDDVRVTSAALRQVLTLRVVSAPLARGIDQVVTERVLARVVTPGEAGTESWPTFGSVDDPPAHIGFAISSAALELAGGERTITLALQFDPGCEASGVLTALSAAVGITPRLLLQQVLQHAFTLEISTAAGWTGVGSYAVQMAAEDAGATFEMRFTLSRDAPAVAGIADSSVAWPSPAVRAWLRQERISVAGPRAALDVYPLSVLEGVVITRVTVNVDVIGLRGMRLSTVAGDVDQSTPIAVFGAIPTVGSALRVRDSELFSKAVTRLVLHIQWHDLPRYDTGFHGYFRGYSLDQDGNVRPDLFDNRVFRAAVTVERPGAWTIDNGRPGHDAYLYRTTGHAGPVPGRAMAVAARTSLDDLVVQPLPPPSPDYDARDGCLRLELSGPDYAFGQALYQQNMMRAALQVAPTEAVCDTTCREQYADFAETRRQLEALLKQLRRKRPLAAIGYVASPRFWVGGPLRALNKAYLTATRSLPAYATERPDPAPRSASAISVHYADADAPEPGWLPVLDRRTSRRMTATRFEAALRTLLNQAEACLTPCIAALKDRGLRDERDRLQQQLMEARALPGPERLASLEDLHRRVEHGAATSAGESTQEMSALCGVMLQAASSVSDCNRGCIDAGGWNYWNSVCANLSTCTAELQKLHDRAIGLCKQACLRPKSRPIPNPPFVPQAEAITIDYSATGSAALTHLLPYSGYRRTGNKAPRLLPHWPAGGNLYLGFSRGWSAATLRLHVQLGQARTSLQEPPIAWNALMDNRWLPIEATAHGDGTHGLQRSGIVSLFVPPGDSGVNTVLPVGLRWFGAWVSEDVDGFPVTIAILPHAVTAIRKLSDTAVDDAGRAVPAHSIRSFVKPIKGIGSIVQPSPSFGGRSPESERALLVRMSERLRHKDRATLGWDYERLVLERFPDIWMVRTIPARRPRSGDRHTAGPGHVRIVVVPGQRYPGLTDATAPTATGDTLAAIARMLQGTAGPFVTLHVLNPLFVRLKVTAVVRWRTPAEAAASAERLNAALIQYVSPWGADAHGAGRPTADVDGFVRSFPDVEWVHALEFSYESDPEAETEPERCLLTSALQHSIRSVVETNVALSAG